MSLFDTIVTTEHRRRLFFRAEISNSLREKPRSGVFVLHAIQTLKCMSANILLAIHGQRVRSLNPPPSEQNIHIFLGWTALSSSSLRFGDLWSRLAHRSILSLEATGGGQA